MTLLGFLRFLIKGDRSNMDVPVVEQRLFLEKLPVPKDDQHRSFLQYKCQMFFAPKWKTWLFETIATLIYFPLVLLEMGRSMRIKRIEHYDALSNLKGFEEVIPDELSSRYNFLHYGWNPKGRLSCKDALYCIKVFFRFFPFSYFSLKAMIKVAQYSELIKQYSPHAIVTHLEFSFASSLLTDFCHRRGIKHINVMHGEKLYNIRDTFFHFDECYVWNEYYIRLFMSLKAENNQFMVSVPPSLKIDLEKNYNEDSYADYKYFLAEFNEEQINSIKEALAFVKKQGLSLKFRLHPRYMDQKLIEACFTSAEIEDPLKVSIIESVASCKYAVGCYSTVLAQAYLSGREVVLDDVAYADTFKKLSEYGYWLIEKQLPRLSEINN